MMSDSVFKQTARKRGKIHYTAPFIRGFFLDFWGIWWCGRINQVIRGAPEKKMAQKKTCFLRYGHFYSNIKPCNFACKLAQPNECLFKRKIHILIRKSLMHKKNNRKWKYPQVYFFLKQPSVYSISLNVILIRVLYSGKAHIQPRFQN